MDNGNNPTRRRWLAGAALMTLRLWADAIPISKRLQVIVHNINRYVAGQVSNLPLLNRNPPNNKGANMLSVYHKGNPL